MTFLFPALTLGFLFVAVPLLVHLINMLRHRRQQWAAMDFLLASYRKQKKWIILRQFLLWLARTAIAAVLIAMLCGWVGGSRLLSSVGGRMSHHVVILDDSYSMADASSGRPAYERALETLRSLTEGLAKADGQQQLTVLRASRAALVADDQEVSGDSVADLAVQTVTGDSRLINRLMSTAVSPLSIDMVPALRMGQELIANTPADETVVYMISDFRERNWQNPERLTEILQGLAAEDIDLRCIDCVDDPAPNLAITRVSPLPDVWVAGVPVVVQVAIQNHSQTEVSNVNVAARVIRYGAMANTADPSRRYSGTVDLLPGVVIDRLAAGEEVVRQFQVFVTEPGTHAIEVTIPDDAVAIDNSRVCTLPLTNPQRVLIVDGDDQQQGAYHIASVLNPGSQVQTGAIPEIRPSSFLRSATLEDLLPYRAIYCVDPETISQNTAVVLQQYVSQGGGLAWFLGSNVQPEKLTEILLAEGRGLLPGALTESVPLPLDEQASSNIVMVGDHPLTAPLEPLGDAAFGRVGLTNSWGLDTEDPRLAGTNPPRRVLERQDGRPLAVQHTEGKGRVLTFLAGLDPKWSNWAGDPTFVVMLLRANAFMWSGKSEATSRWVDEPLEIEFSKERFGQMVQLLTAVQDPPRVPIEMQAVEQAGGLEITIDPRTAEIDGAADVAALLTPGITEAWLSPLDGPPQVVPYASVVRTEEGNLIRADRAQMQRDVQPAVLTFYDNKDIVQQSTGAGGSAISMLLLAILGTLLASEQALAYWASYHTPRGSGVRS
ncbi:hypothetical protein FF011L_21290 [Roseimaritima multifibrata]|uniref:Aerotolerance regulator N-terminal domain-containing protein n=1 Tax=Roseimaritima multifibrata TaxID=1930274 RepID=A0A517MEV1_9BACT|nr:BatA domain-containing protein [Roseimaritima multifibrata]QDS93366.1 hypothetical protein FF011L_21290 [Roseimaritima multifibrata]